MRQVEHGYVGWAIVTTPNCSPHKVGDFVYICAPRSSMGREQVFVAIAPRFVASEYYAQREGLKRFESEEELQAFREALKERVARHCNRIVSCDDETFWKSYGGGPASAAKVVIARTVARLIAGPISSAPLETSRDE